MIFGIPVEIRNYEYRVGAAPFLVEELVKQGHKVLVETNAGLKSHYADIIYEEAGASIVPSAEKLYSQADCILKVQEPMPVEYELIRPEHIVLAYFYFLNNLDMARSLMARGCSCISYDMLRNKNGIRPLVDVEGMIVGQLAVQQGAHYMRTQKGGRGFLLGSVPGVASAQVVVLGASSAGISAASYAANLGASVFLLDRNFQALRQARENLPANVNILVSHKQNFKKLFPNTDLLISAFQDINTNEGVIVSKASVKLLPKGAIVIDLDIDFGGFIETSTPTTHESPAVIIDGIIHYCVPNLAGVVPGTASEALSSALMPYLFRFSNQDFIKSVQIDEELISGLAIYEGRIVNSQLAERLSVSLYEFDEAPG